VEFWIDAALCERGDYVVSDLTTVLVDEAHRVTQLIIGTIGRVRVTGS
jgi:hypothetical protein